MNTQEHINLAEEYGAHNYSPLPVVISSAKGVWVTDVDGHKYIDMLSSYSALNFGHSHPAIVKTMKEQLDKVVVTSRAFYNDQYGPFCKELSEFCGMEVVLPMNSGAEAVETSIKTCRKWGYDVKGVERDKAEIICFYGNFHGRTTTIISFSDDPTSRDGFGPYTPGFKLVPYGDANAVQNAITPNTVGVLVEPIQGEGGIIVPAEGYLAELRKICTQNNVLLIMDEIQTGIGRTGRDFACQYENVKPDILVLGKALGGGVLPVSAIVSTRQVMRVMTPGIHGSTFGGMPLSCAVAREALRVLKRENLTQRAFELGNYMRQKLRDLHSPIVKEVRGKGLLIGVEIKTQAGHAKPLCKAMKKLGVLCKDTHKQVIRYAPPLIITETEIDWAVERIQQVLCGDPVAAHH